MLVHLLHLSKPFYPDILGNSVNQTSIVILYVTFGFDSEFI